MIIGADSSFFCECGGIKRAGESKCWDCKRLGHLHIPMGNMYTVYRKGGETDCAEERRIGKTTSKQSLAATNPTGTRSNASGPGFHPIGSQASRHRPITSGNDYKEDALAKVQAEVRDLVDEIRKYGFTAAIEGDQAYHIYKDGKAVISDTGRPITIHTTPSDNRWYKNIVAVLIRSKVLPADPKKEGQMRKAREERPPELEEARRRKTEGIVAARQRERERDKPIIDAAIQLRRDLGASHGDMVKFLIQVGKEQGLDVPSERGVSDHVYKIYNGRTESMSSIYRRMWKATFKYFNVEIDIPEDPVVDDQPVELKVTPSKGSHGKRSSLRLVEQEHTAPENPGPNQCAICGFQAKDLRGLRAHERGHKTTECPYCHNTVPMLGIGQHKKWCDKNPANARTLRATHVEPSPIVSASDEEFDAFMDATGNGDRELGVQVVEEEREVSPVTTGNEDQVRSMNQQNIGKLMKNLYDMDQQKFLMFLLNSDLDKSVIVGLIQLLSD